MQTTSIPARKGTTRRLATGLTSLAVIVVFTILGDISQGAEPGDKLVGVYVHQHWPYHDLEGLKAAQRRMTGGSDR